MKTFFLAAMKETFAKICVVASLETLREDPTVRIRDKQAAWKLLSKISRTVPGLEYSGVAICWWCKYDFV